MGNPGCPAGSASCARRPERRSPEEIPLIPGPGLIHSEGMRLNQATVGAVDLARSEEFYLTLGLRLIVKDQHYLRFECPEGDSTFSVELVGSVPRGEQVTVYFESDDLDGLCDRLITAGLPVDQTPQDMPWLWREARLADPDGHTLCLFSAGEHRRYPPWRISDGPSQT
jgi:catechol 2,3-dioxygenase-like lactoylglutathione lyase family enzyme